MTQYQSSIVIPVYNKWELTRNCLKSLAETTDRNRVEVIVVDNASRDVTPKACAFLGEKLFGSGFKFIRNEQNRNFSGACNQGAEAARGEYVIFLNNDTVAEAGWHDPLIQDFRDFPNIAATGPVLVYPEQTPFGRLVQHLGVIVTPYLKVGHLYQGLPACSSLAKKRRFFQAITGACFAITKDLFQNAGGFDEGYENGYEDVDICARFTGMGYKFTVNPEAQMIHYEGQTPGRGARDGENFSRFLNSNLKYLKPDWISHIEQDGFALELDNWLSFNIRIVPEMEKLLNSKLATLDFDELKDTLGNYIYWDKGWQKLLSLPQARSCFAKYFAIYFLFFRNIPNAAQAIKIGIKFKDHLLQRQGRDFLRIWDRNPEELLEEVKAAKVLCKRFNMATFSNMLDNWINKYNIFVRKIYPYYQSRYFTLIDT